MDEIAELKMKVAELEGENEQLRRIAYVDDLTGLPNRRMFWRRYLEAWSELVAVGAESAGADMFLFFADIDDFRSYNKKGGQRRGDKMLAGAAAAMSGVLGGGTMLARYGGEEFAGFSYRCDKQTGLVIAERLRSSVEERGYGTTITIGVAGYREDAPRTPEAFIHMANRAMLAGKENGKNAVVPYTSGLWDV